MSDKNLSRLVLIDGHSLLFRAFHAYPPLTTSKGELVNAVYGFTSILLNVIRELGPTYLAVAFDRDKPTFRHIEYVGYKAQREEMPTELASQQERVEEVVKTLNIPMFAVEGYEADDVIGTLARQATAPKIPNSKFQIPNKSQISKSKFKEAESNELDEVVIVTGDNDMLQVVDDGLPARKAAAKGVRVRVYVPGRGKQPAKIYGEKDVEEKYGLEPGQIPDLKSLMGDSSDNIPGVKGIGPKKAAELLKKLKSVENVYKNLGEVRKDFGERVATLLINEQESAMLSKKLAVIVKDVPIELDLSRCEVVNYDKIKVLKLFEELEFRSLINKLPNDSFEQMVEEVLF